MESMSMRVSFTSNTSTDGAAVIGSVVPALLKYPCVPVGIAEIGEAGIVRPGWIEARQIRTAPSVCAGVLVPDLADVDSPIREFACGRLDVGHHQVQTAYRAHRCIGQADTELD